MSPRGSRSTAPEPGSPLDCYLGPGGPFDPSGRERLLRLVYTPLLRLLGPRWGRRLTSAAKRNRGAGQPIPALGCPAPPASGPGLVVLSHDVDWETCYGFLPELVAMEEAAGVRSTIFMLTQWWYRPDRGYLAELQGRGFEIGLHGRFHDAGIAYRSPGRIRRDLGLALAALPPGVRGYRSPALSVSRRLYRVLVELGLAYDSSLLVVNRYGACCPHWEPFPLWGLTELPLTMQDDLLFRDLDLSDRQALAEVAGRMDQVVAAGGVFVFNAHPGIAARHQEFYRGLLEHLVQRGHRTSLAAQAAGLAPAEGAA